MVPKLFNTIIEILFQLIIKFLQLCGMCPISLNFQSINNKTSIRNGLFAIWSIIIMLIIIIYVILTVGVLHDTFLEQKSRVGKFNDIAKFCTTMLTHFIIVCESLLTRKHQYLMWQKVFVVDRCFDKMDIQNITIYKQKFHQYYVIKFFLYILMTLTIEIIIITSIRGDLEWQSYWYSVIFSLMMTRIRHLQQSLFIDLLTSRFSIIKCELKQIVHFSRKQLFTNKDDIESVKVIEKLKYSKLSYNILYEICNHLNKSVGYSQLANLMQNFIQLTSDLYWIYFVLNKNSFTNLLENCFSLIPTFTVLALVMYSCEKCLREVRLIGFLLHNIEKDIENSQFDILIENFSLQILHEPFEFSISGFFNMDFMLFKSMIAAITTYMVIFIQFMPKEETQLNDTANDLIETTTVETTALSVITLTF